MRTVLRALHLWNDSLDMESGWAWVLGVVVITLVISGVIFSAVTYGGRAYGSGQCANWGKQTGIKTKFVVLGWADSGTCLAKTPDGRWILNSNWQSFVKGNK